MVVAFGLTATEKDPLGPGATGATVCQTPPAGLASSETPATPGSTVTLGGTAEGLAGVTLEAKPAGGAWQALAPVAPGPGGSFSITVSPQATTLYRLAAGSVRGAAITVSVAA